MNMLSLFPAIPVLMMLGLWLSKSARQVRAVMVAGSSLLLALAVVLTFISFALINNMIRLAIYSKRFLIHTMKLVGASWSFIRGPFLRKNVWSGVLAGMLADAILMGTAYWAVTYEQELIQVITPEVMLIVCGSVLVFGIVITWLCAYISMNKYLRMKANTLYYI